jgi:acyl transferase domain-containing protein/NADPH:quinone reductase-like Zn-dependent oxidoreductase/SAM-dependent methyltransferase/acyl carrier protein
MSDEKSELTPLKRAFLAVQSLQGQVEELQQARTEPLAVVGMACRFPRADSPEQFWSLLAGGVDAISERPEGRWRGDLIDGSDTAAAGAARWGGFLPSIDQFDPLLFGIAPREAMGMDPQQRLFLEVCWEAFESAGFAPDRLKGQPIGVFAGVCTNDYSSLQTRDGDLQALNTHYASGIAHSILPGRVSYLLGLTGPSVALDTACSSSLVAVHLACQALRNGDCEAALAGGVNAILLPDNAVAFARAGMMAADGRCKAFDAAADGFVRGEGCGVVLLKRLSKALADRDPIQAVILGTAVNQDGASAGLTAPSGRAQEAVIRAAVKAAGILPAEIGYVEAHGTGTVLGDPIEVQAIGGALGDGRPSDRPLLIGSVKSNFGHLEAAAGIAGLIKNILSLQHGVIPPSLHLRTPSPVIPWDRLPVQVAATLTPWGDRPRLAGVSSFGFGGTNAHVVIGEAPTPSSSAAAETERPRHVLVLSAPTATGLRAVAARYAAHIEAHPEQLLSDVAHTANVGRAQFRHRAAAVFGAEPDLGGRLRAFSEGLEVAGIQGRQVHGEAPRIAFLFSGQGSQYAGMGRQLFESQPVFRRVLSECASLVGDKVQPGILQVIYPEEGAERHLDRTVYTQPALFAFEYALARMWESWGVTPAAVMGHSLGEYVAATVAGVLQLDDALRLVTIRGRLSERVAGDGEMAAVLAPVGRVRATLAALGNPAEIAAVNAPESTVVSGPRDGVAAARRAFAADGIEVKPLAVSTAFHSAAVEPMLEEFEEAASSVAYGPQTIPLFSNLFGRRTQPGEISSASYWVRHLRQPVQFAAGFSGAVDDGFSTFLEIGPHTTLLGLGRQCFPNSPGAWLPSLRRGADDWEVLLGSLVELYLEGTRIEWSGFDRGYARRRLVLPSYPFERQRYWVAASSPQRPGRRSPRPGHPLVQTQISSPFVTGRVFESVLDAEIVPWLADHKVMDATVLPTTAYLEAAWAAGFKAFGASMTAVEDLDILEALVVPVGGARRMQVAVLAAEDGRAALKVASAGEHGTEAEVTWESHASGWLSLRPAPGEDAWPSLQALRARCVRPVDVVRLREAVTTRGITLGPSFQGLLDVAKGGNEAIGRIQPPAGLESQLPDYHVHPAVLDAALQVVSAAFLTEDELATGGDAYLPVAVERFRVLKPPQGESWGHAALRHRGHGESPIADIRVYDSTGEAVAEVVGLQLQRVTARAWAKDDSVSDDLYEMQWQPVTPADELPPAGSAACRTPAPEDIAASLAPGLAELASGCEMEAYALGLRDVDRLCAATLVDTLRGLGWGIQLGARFREEELREQLGVVGQHRRLFSRLLSILAEEHILARQGETWVVEREPASGTVGAESVEALRARFPAGGGELGLLARTIPELGACLTGRTDPLTLLFPGGRFDVADELYRKSPPARLLNALARDAVRALLASTPAGTSIHALEIGAGTGGTTSFLLPVLPADRTKYEFTDISPLFLARAQEGFQAFPFVEYRLLDIERDPSSQGFSPGAFDVVIAANVLHATRDLGETLAHVRRLVRPGGMLLLLEGTRPERWIDLTFGLTDGWWRFSDQVRRDYPLVGRREWADLLSKSGFEQVAAVPAAGCDEALEQNLLMMARVAPAGARRWVVFADRGGTAASLTEDLSARGLRTVTVVPGDDFNRRGDLVELPPGDGAAYRRLLESLGEDTTTSLAGVAHLWSLDRPVDDRTSVAELGAAQDAGSRSVLYLAQALATFPSTTSARLVLVTRGAQAVGSDRNCSPGHAPIWGMARTIRLEQPDLDCSTIDLDPGSTLVPKDFAVRVLGGAEPEWAEREGHWHVARLVRRRGATAPCTPAPSARVALVNEAVGTLDGLRYVPVERVPPGPGEIEIRVTASALNFRDVLIALGLYPEPTDATALGGECAGEVLAVGPGVLGVSPGDEVVAMAPGAFGSHAIARAELALPIPPGLTYEEAVTLPSAFLTAWHALYDLAHLGPGETVLVHSGAGGVGLAAVQLAQRVGARVFATAGSHEKRDYLRSLGVDLVMDSRSLLYCDEILERTGGRGADVVLNSLTDEHIARSIHATAQEGRFVELGRRGIWTAERVREVRPGVRYVVVDLAETGRSRPEVVGGVLRQVFEAVRAGEIRPLPTSLFRSADIVGAFRYMAQARHIGKVVLVREVRRQPVEIRGDASYLVTGGLGGLGLVTARWLVEMGAGRVVLMARRPPGSDVARAIHELNRDRACVSIIQGDVGSEADVRRALAHAATHPLRGIVHAAGALHDGVLLGQDWQNFRATFDAKVDGTWLLHQLTRDARLDFFVLFSSISALFGSAGQANHAAANAFMDSVAHYRRRRGLRCTSINWGAWSEVGAALGHDVAGRMASQGMGTITPSAGLAALTRLLDDDVTQAAVIPVDWERFSAQFAGGRLRSSFLVDLTNEEPGRLPGGHREATPPATSRAVEPPLREAAASVRWGRLLQRVRDLAAKVLGLQSAARVDVDRPLQEMGLDSLMAVELRNLMKNELGLDRPPAATVVFDHPTVSALARFVGCELFGWPPETTEPVSTAPAAEEDVLGRLERLAPEDVERLLSERMKDAL